MGPNWQWVNMFGVMLQVEIFTLVDHFSIYLSTYHYMTIFLSITI